MSNQLAALQDLNDPASPLNSLIQTRGEVFRFLSMIYFDFVFAVFSICVFVLGFWVLARFGS